MKEKFTFEGYPCGTPYFFEDHFVIIHPDNTITSSFSDTYHVLYFDYDLKLLKKEVRDQEWLDDFEYNNDDDNEAEQVTELKCDDKYEKDAEIWQTITCNNKNITITIETDDSYATCYKLSVNGEEVNRFDDPEAIYQIGDGDTDIYCINDKHYLVFNSGDVWSTVLIKRQV